MAWVIGAGPRDEAVLLVSREQAAALGAEGRYEPISRVQTMHLLDVALRRDAVAARRFAASASLFEYRLDRIGDEALRQTLLEWTECGRLLGMRRAAGDLVHRDGEKKRLLAKELETLARGSIPWAGAQYRVVADFDVDRLPDRQLYEVERRADAQKILDGVARSPATSKPLADLLLRAKDMLSPDWSPPFEPDGMVLLRRRLVLPVPRVVADDHRYTPSELAPRDSGDDKPGVHSYLLRVLDHRGEPVVAGLALDIAGSPLTTNSTRSGDAVVPWSDDVPARLRITNLAAVRRSLKPKWKKPPASDMPAAQGTVIHVPFAEDFEPVSIDPDRPYTLVLERPHFRCAEVPGVHFEFGHSFVKSTAFESLSQIAASIMDGENRKALVVGHTDRSGSEALNKELSERRAKALHALFTHDAGAWEELSSGTADGPNWKEKWDVAEAQHMLNALRVTDDDGNPLAENGERDAPTKQAIRRFQRGDYPDVPAEQEPLAEADVLGKDGRRQLFLAYAKRIARAPVPADRFIDVGGAPFVGCGEYNPLSESAKDAESRRCVVFVFDPELEPDPLPCAFRSIAPCKQRLSNDPPADGAPPYACCAYRDLATECPCAGGADTSHDLVLKFPVTLEEADALPHVYTLESEDGTLVQEKSLAGDARANDEGAAELLFSDLPPRHTYRLQCREDGDPYVVFDYATLEELKRYSERPAEGDADADLIASAFEPGQGSRGDADGAGGSGGDDSGGDGSGPQDGAVASAGGGDGPGTGAPGGGGSSSGAPDATA